MSIGDEIKAAREARGLSQRALAEAIGCTQPAISDMEKGTTLRSHYLTAAQKFLGIGEKLTIDAQPLTPFNPPEGEIFGPRDLRLYAAAEGGPGEMVVHTDPIELLPRPWYLGMVSDGYAVLVVGESMVPAFRPGQIAIVNPRLAPMRGREMLFRQTMRDGTFVGSIKHLVRWTVAEWHVEQFNPAEGAPRTFVLDRRVWEAHRIVGSYDNG